MSKNRQWLELGLDTLEPAVSNRVRVFRLLLSQAAALRSQLDRELAPTGVTVQQAAMLQWIEAQAEPPTMSATAEGLHMSHQNVKQIAAVLERKGFVTIEVDATDRRARRLVLTAHHQAFWAQRNPQDFTRLQQWTAAWSDEEVQTLVNLLQRLPEQPQG